MNVIYIALGSMQESTKYILSNKRCRSTMTCCVAGPCVPSRCYTFYHLFTLSHYNIKQCAADGGGVFMFTGFGGKETEEQQAHIPSKLMGNWYGPV